MYTVLGGICIQEDIFVKNNMRGLYNEEDEWKDSMEVSMETRVYP